MRIRDYSVRRFTEDLQRQSQGQPKLDDGNVLKLLAAVGDTYRSNSTRILEQLSAPGLSRQQQLDLAKSGLAPSERSDLEAILDQSNFDMSPGAKNFLEALVGRAPLLTTFGPLTITGDQKNGIAGIARPGEVIEAINLSTAPAGRLHLTDTMEIGNADAFGKFQGILPDMKEGDLIRLRTRAADGSTSDWLTITARGIEAADTRNAEVNLERMDLAANADGTVGVTHNTGRPLSEPGATLRFTNTRTGETKDIKVTDTGSLPEGTRLNGRAGDTFSIAASDGKNNTSFATVAGSLKVPGGSDGVNGLDLPDPAPLKDDADAAGSPKYKKVRFTGPLFDGEVKPSDVRQGAIGNCYFPAALASVAHTDPERIKNMIKQNEDGTYTVTFHEASSWGGATGEKVEVTVDGDLYARSFGGPVYGASLGSGSQPDKMELWFPIVEKAYAQWKGSYEAIGNGGVSGKVMSEVLGGSYDYTSISDYNKDGVWQQIQEGEQNGWPMTAGTYGKDEAERYTNSGVYANHAYTVLGVEEENGVKYVKLRNPWGQSEPRNNGADDGFFRLTTDEFAKLYNNFAIVKA